MCCARPAASISMPGRAAAYWTHYGPGDWYLDAVAQATRYEGAASTQFASLDQRLRLRLVAGGRLSDSRCRCSDRASCWSRRRRSSGNVCRSTTPMTAWARSRSARRQARAGGSACAADGPSSATAGRCGSPICAPIFGVTGGRRRRRRIPASIWCRCCEQADRLQLGGGLSVRMNANVSLYANADYQFAVGDTDGGRRNGVRGAAGLRCQW